MLLEKCIILNLTTELKIKDVFDKVRAQNINDLKAIEFLSMCTHDESSILTIQEITSSHNDAYHVTASILYDHDKKIQDMEVFGCYKKYMVYTTSFFGIIGDAGRLKHLFSIIKKNHETYHEQIAFEIFNSQSEPFGIEVYKTMFEELDADGKLINFIAKDIKRYPFNLLVQKIISNVCVSNKQSHCVDEYLIDYVFSKNNPDLIRKLRFNDLFDCIWINICKEKNQHFGLFKYMLKKCCEDENLLRTLGIGKALQKSIIRHLYKENILWFKNLIEACDGNIVLLQEITADSEELNEAMAYNIYLKEEIGLVREQLKQLKQLELQTEKSEHIKLTKELPEILNTNSVKLFEINGGYIASQFYLNPLMIYSNQQSQQTIGFKPANALTLYSDQQSQSGINFQPDGLIKKLVKLQTNIFFALADSKSDIFKKDGKDPGAGGHIAIPDDVWERALMKLRAHGVQ